jgi:hypothetical protein
MKKLIFSTILIAASIAATSEAFAWYGPTWCQWYIGPFSSYYQCF